MQSKVLDNECVYISRASYRLALLVMVAQYTSRFNASSSSRGEFKEVKLQVNPNKHSKILL